MSTQYAWNTQLTVQIVARWCPECGIPYGLPEGFIKERQKDHQTWYCPNGHQRHFPRGKTDAQKLQDAEARETALRDQLQASIRDGEVVRTTLVRDRSRFAKGVCPCCNRYFLNVHRHMTSEHPDYDVTKVEQHGAPVFKCSCGRQFKSLQGLKVHQGRQRRDGWDAPKTPAWRAHLTRV